MAIETLPEVETPKSPEDIERHWFENVYAGDRMPQLTLRALVMGMLLGAVMSLSNVYVGLKAGWGLGVAITSAILAFAAFSALRRLFPRFFPEFSILENNAMASCASAAGYMTGAGVVNAIPALMMLRPEAVPGTGVLMVWIGVVSMLGVFLAVPAKRQEAKSTDCNKQLARAYIDAGCIRMQDGNSSHRFFFAIGSPEYRSDAQGANQRQTPNRDRRQS